MSAMDSTEVTSISFIMNELQTLTAAFKSLLLKNNLPQPSLGTDGPADYPTSIGDDTKAFTNTRYKIVDAARQLITLALGPRESLLRSGFSQHDNLSLAIISQYSIAKAIHLNTPTSITSISKSIDLSEHRTRSVLRHAIANGIFTEPIPEHIAHNALSKLLLDPKMDAWIAHTTTDVVPAASSVLESWKRFPDSNEAGETGFSLAVGKGKTLFEYLAESESARDRFSLAMAGLTGGGAFDVGFLVKGYPWGNLPEGATVVDLGGSDGTVAYALASSQHPTFRFVVQDLEGVVSQARESLPPYFGDVTFQAHDFFTPQPVEADVYIIRHVLHNWSDKYCIQILRHLVAAMKPSSKIIVNDAVIVEPTGTTAEQYWMMSAMNLQMITLLNAKERTLRDWTELFLKADPRLVISTVSKPTGSQTSIIEVVLKGQSVDGFGSRL